MLAAAPFRPTMHNAADACRLFRPGFAGGNGAGVRTQVAYLDDAHRLVALERIGDVRAGRPALPIRAILSRALALGSNAVLIAHACPRAEPTARDADLRVTRALADAARPLGIRVLDHLIFAGAHCTSVRQLGLL